MLKSLLVVATTTVAISGLPLIAQSMPNTFIGDATDSSTNAKSSNATDAIANVN